MIPIKITGWVVDGKLIPSDVDLLKDYLNKVSGQKVEVIIQKFSEPKTPNQLGYYWGHLVPQIGEHIGEPDKEVVHGILKYHFLRAGRGTENEYVMEMSMLDKTQTADYIHKVYHLGLELGAEVFPSDTYYNKGD
jgi:hypothetical protein